MQNRYVGDLGDFGKYGLLKRLCYSSNDQERTLSLGVVWYLVPDESHTEDGKYIAYLQMADKNIRQFRDCDQQLYDKLACIVNNNHRNVSYIEQDNILPIGTKYYSDYLTFKKLPNIGSSSSSAKIEYRNKWLEQALNITANCNVVFVDPDNGLEVSSVARHNKTGPKYVYYDELCPYIQREQSLIIYHHLCRNGSALDQIDKRLTEINEFLSPSTKPFAMLYKRGTLKTFFVVPSKQDYDFLFNRAKMMINDSFWSNHFEIYN